MSAHTCACCGEEPQADTVPTRTCYCPLDGILDTISKRHALQVITVLGANGPMRYGELETALDVNSTSTFTERLEELTDAGLIERRSFDGVPPRVEYSLTPVGRELESRLQPLLAWAADRS